MIKQIIMPEPDYIDREYHGLEAVARYEYEYHTGESNEDEQ